MAIKVFPSANGAGGAGQKVLSEGNLEAWMAAAVRRNYVVNGLDLSGNDTSTLTISSGTAIIAGHAVIVDSSIAIQLSGTQFTSCRLSLVRDALGAVSSVTAQLVSTNTPLTADDLHLGHVYVVLGKVYYIDYSQGRYAGSYDTPYDAFVNRYDAFDTCFDSIDGYATSVTSSAAVTLDAAAGCLKLATSSTSGSSATVQKRSYLGIFPRQRPDFWNEQWLGIAGQIEGATVGAASEAWLVVGAPGTQRHIGFVSIGGEIFGTIGNGSTETRTSRLADSTINRLVAHYVPGKYAEFWADLSSHAVITSNLPVGYESAAADRCMMYASLKTTNAAVKQMRLASWQWQQLL